MVIGRQVTLTVEMHVSNGETPNSRVVSKIPEKPVNGLENISKSYK